MKIAWNDYKASQKLFLDKDTDELQITTQANFQDGISPIWWGLSVIAALALGFGVEWRMRRQRT